MVAVDTNIVARFIVRDDEKQYQAVRRLFQRAEQDGRRIFISYVVVLETLWVLEKIYGFNRREILNAIQSLCEMSIFKWESDILMDRFLQFGSTEKIGLSDLLIALVAEANECETCVTFDKAAARRPYFDLLEV